MSPTIGVVVFTVVELVTLVAWLVLAGVPLANGRPAAIVVLAVGLLIEHVAAFNVGAGQPTFQFPLRRP